MKTKVTKKKIILFLIIFLIILLLVLLIINRNKIEYFNTKKIGIVSWSDEQISNYANLSEKINKKYCIENNIDYIHSHKRYFKDRTPHWEKVNLVLNTLKTNQYEYVMWIDADAHFNLNVKYKKLLQYLDDNKKTDIIFAADEKKSNRPICTGVFIVKNTDYSKNILDKWKNNKECIHLYKTHFHEQECITDMYNKNFLNLKSHSVIIPHEQLQIFPQQWEDSNNTSIILHYAGWPSDYKIKQLKQYITNFNIDTL